MRLHLLQWTVLTSVSLVALSAPAFAQETADGEGAANSNTIIVTARGREQALKDVPVSVSVVGGEALTEQNLQTLSDVAPRLGNVKITTTSLNSFINIRGTGSGANPGFEQSVATFSDGVYRSTTQSTRAALFDVDRVEVLKGPQTTFFGANAIAGALNITTNRPGDSLEYNASALYGSDGEYSVEAGVTVPLSETVSIRGAARFQGMDGYIDTPTGTGPNEDNFQGRFSIRFEPSDVWRTDLRVDYIESDIENMQVWELVGCPPPAPFTLATPRGPNNCALALAANGIREDELNYQSDSAETFGNYEFVEVALTNALELDAGTVRSITAYADQNYDFLNSLIPVQALAGFSPAALLGYDALPSYNGQDYKFFSQELRFESQTGGFLEYMVGGYYSTGSLQTTSSTGFFFAPFGFLIDSVLGGGTGLGFDTPVTGSPVVEIDDRTLSAFASATLNLSDTARLNLGLRYSNVRKKGNRVLSVGTTVNGNPDTFEEFDNPAYGQVFCVFLGCTIGNFTQSVVENDQFMPSASFQLDLNDDVMAYAGYARGFKAGGFSGTATASVFGPETVDSYELGLKGYVFDRSLQFSLAGFYMNYDGLQETVFDQNLQSVIRNAASSVSKGIELSASWRVADFLTLSTDLAYLDSYYREYTGAGCTPLQTFTGECAANGGSQDLSGADRPYAPSYSGSVSADLRLPLDDFELAIQPTFTFSDHYFLEATADPYQLQRSYEKIDLRIGFGPADGPWELALIGKNLTDETIVLTALGTPGSLGSYNVLPDRGRSFAVQITLRN